MADPVDRLYAATLDDFIAVRREVVSALKQAGEDDRAAEVATYRKPSVTVWALNQAARRKRADAQSLAHVAEKVAAVQARRSRGDLRREQDRLREVTARLVDEAERALEEAGRPVPGTLGQRLHDLVRAVTADEEARGALAAGRLLEEPELGGFAALGAPGNLPPAATPTATATAPARTKTDEARRRRETERRRRLEQLRAELREAEAAAAEAHRAAEQADRRLAAVRRSIDRHAQQNR